MKVKHFTSSYSFIQLVQKIAEFVEPQGNKIEFVDIKYLTFTNNWHAVLIYKEVSGQVGGPR